MTGSSPVMTVWVWYAWGWGGVWVCGVDVRGGGWGASKRCWVARRLVGVWGVWWAMTGSGAATCALALAGCARARECRDSYIVITIRPSTLPSFRLEKMPLMSSSRA